MYIPAHFVQSEITQLQDFIDQHSFATVVSWLDDAPFASHLPLLLNRESGTYGTLEGHFALANPQWKTDEEQQLLIIFHGPHAYISPTWYESLNVVPTWNYVAVHAYGRLKVVQEPERLLNIIKRTVDRFEKSMLKPWGVESQNPKFIEQLMGAIVGFEVVLNRLEGKWKVSQNQSVERRQRVIHGLREAGYEDALKIADLISEQLEQ